MKLYAMNQMVCKPYKPNSHNTNSLIVANNDTDCFVKVIDIHESDNGMYKSVKKGDIVWCKKEDMTECILNGEKYIAVHPYDVLAIIKEEE